MRRKTRVAVLMGGRSPEHQISLQSGKEVVRNLNPNKYDTLPIIISEDGISWQIGDRKQFLTDSPASKKVKSQKSKIKDLKSNNPHSLIKTQNIDVVFIAMHGPYGEDGTIQGFLELVDVPYTGSKVLASALGMDKIISRNLFIQSGLKVPGYTHIEKGQDTNSILSKFKLPVFVKPSNQGSSVGISKIVKKKNLTHGLKEAFRYSNRVIIEEFIKGTEITGSILGSEDPKALPIVEIIPATSFFDYKAKYNESLCEEIVPARISSYLTKKAQNAALCAYRAVGCVGFGRVDMIIRKGNVYVLEVNTIPGLTPVSLFPKAAKAAGISYPLLLDKIIKFVVTRSAPLQQIG